MTKKSKVNLERLKIEVESEFQVILKMLGNLNFAEDEDRAKEIVTDLENHLRRRFQRRISSLRKLHAVLIEIKQTLQDSQPDCNKLEKINNLLNQFEV